MIQLVTGKLGAGKTLYSTMLMFDALVAGKIVATNIAVDWDAMVKLARTKHFVVLDPSQLVRVDPRHDKDWHRKIPFGLGWDFVEVFLDEIHLFFNARDWAETAKCNKELVSFLSQSRKARVNITFIVQSEETLDRQFRLQAEWLLFIVNSSHMPLGILGSLPMKFFIVVKKDAQNGNIMSRTCRSYDRRYFGLYDSFSFLDDTMQQLSDSRPRLPALKLSRVSPFRVAFESIVNLFRPKKCAS